ncbi:MAG: endospore germination permease [Caloramator sp.]|nr:endospore germination permease [Caloramator sp.]
MKETISVRQSIFTMIMFIIGSSVIITSGVDAKGDLWIAVIIALIAALAITWVYSKILSIKPDKDFVDILELIFGKFFGRLLAFLFVFFAFHLGSLVLRNFGEFIKTIGLPETPNSILMLLCILLAILSVKSGIEIIGRGCELFLLILLFLVLLTIPFSIPEMDINNLRPMLYEGILPVLKGAFATFSFPFAETIVFLFILPSTNKSQYFKVYYTSLIFAAVVLILLALRNVLILGPETSIRNYFSSYTAVSRINIANFLQRIESIIAISFLIFTFAKINICLYASSKGLSKILGFDDYRFLVTPVGLLMFNFSIIVYENIMQMVEWATKIWPYYSLPFEVFLPLFIYFYFITFKRKKLSN